MLTHERASAVIDNSGIVSIQSDCDRRASAISSDPPVGVAEGSADLPINTRQAVRRPARSRRADGDRDDRSGPGPRAVSA